MTTAVPPKAGLEDVVAASSAICYLDGERGVLAYRGYDIHDLATQATFEEVCYLLWHGRLPTRAELGGLQSELAAARQLPEGILRLMRTLPPDNAMDTMRTLVSALSHYDPQSKDESAEGRYRTSVRLTAQLGSVVATSARLAGGGGLIAPDPVLGHAANFLYMLTGNRPGALATRALDVALVLHADHEFNASTFVGRVSAATLTDVHSAVTGAIGALKGPLHGGANTDVMHLLLELGGHVVETSEDGPSGLAKLRTFRPDIALIDLGLPGIDGYTLARLARGQSEMRGIRLVALTGYGQAEDQQRALAAGFDLHVTKPVDVAKLRAVLG